MRTLILVGFFVALAASATSCASRSGSRGASETRIDENTFELVVRGAANVPLDQVQSELRYKCADLTTREGYDAFVLTDSKDEQSEFTNQVPTMTARDAPAQVVVTKYWTSRATIRLYKGAAPPGAVSAAEVLKARDAAAK